MNDGDAGGGCFGPGVDLAAGLRVSRPGVAEDHAVTVQQDFEGDPAFAAVGAGVDGAVAAQDGGGMAVLGGDLGVAGGDVGCFEDPLRGAGQLEPEVVVEPVQDLHVGAVGPWPVGDVDLPASVGD
ncbi:MAG: hypothetical protein JWN67_5336 [Actinomycetia bacterium]|nr:hypothetical protein [Actinomycetes bacterium]